MKLLLLCLILFFGEQEKKSVTGKYFSDGIFSESIELFADNSFCYNYVGDNMHYNLEGSYSIEDNRLILSKYPCWERFTFSEEKETWKHDVMKDTALIVLRGELSKDGVNNYFTGFHLFLIFDENRIIPFNYHYEKQDYLNQKRSKKKHKASLCFGTTIFPRDRFIGFYMIYYLDGSSMEGILSPTYYVKDMSMHNLISVVFNRQGLPKNTPWIWEETWLIEKDVIKPQRFKEENNSYYLKKIE